MGNIASVRNLEDCIRATKKYTEGVHIMATNHPIQGEDFPSRKFCKYYEFYPDIEISWDMQVGKVAEWLFGNPRTISMTFIYDYRRNRAELQMNKVGDIAEMQVSVPGFRKAIEDMAESGTTGVEQKT